MICRHAILAALLVTACDLPRPSAQLENPRATFRSPCQCRAAGDADGCYLLASERLYQDGTHHHDYDAWGYYVGHVNVPKECRR